MLHSKYHQRRPYSRTTHLPQGLDKLVGKIELCTSLQISQCYFIPFHQFAQISNESPSSALLDDLYSDLSELHFVQPCHLQWMSSVHSQQCLQIFQKSLQPKECRETVVFEVCFLSGQTFHVSGILEFHRKPHPMPQLMRENFSLHYPWVNLYLLAMYARQNQGITDQCQGPNATNGMPGCMSSKHGLTAIAESNTGAIHCSQEAPNLEDSCGSSGAHSQEDWYVCIPSTESNKYYRCMPSSNELQQQELLQAQSYCSEFLSCKKKKKNSLPSRKHNCQGKAQAGPTKSWCSQS